MSKNPIGERVPFLINKSPKYSTWVQPQKWQNDLGSFPKQAIQHHSNPSSVQFSSVSQLCPTLCNLMNRSMPGLPVYHQLPKFTQTHAHWVGDAIQPSHLLSPPSPPAPNPPSIRVFSIESTLHIRWPKYWSFSFSISPSSEHPGLISFRMDKLAYNNS